MGIMVWSSDVWAADLVPMMPDLAEEAWAGLPDARRTTELGAEGAWPAGNPALLADDEVTIVIQVAGKRRDEITLAKGLDKEAVEAAALARSCGLRGRSTRWRAGPSPSAAPSSLARYSMARWVLPAARRERPALIQPTSTSWSGWRS